ncbi:hypothetical protein TTHERM_00152070 (macronuclear) [Tetrahymena thermophila SB210]|uniref:Uncharacterized protein n=1 Tax=Tetrahymena thermophila (strain SB210) TaxID=312017 RepID=I7MGJ3_TETTS|nr:hypothetical protein TTHERM_00152070 [Tetrahymena thermophila SB210]EAS01493.2 hypothetical protein TTHERM_00152070 [Tetrahymena thermophila SB210]|eukprot:XP_001021739.2 hypothetical protein TTHERM_00152070 [Tetrahymena thermophila SB210]
MAYNKAQKHSNFQTEFKEHYIVDEQDFQGQQQLQSSQQSQGVQTSSNQLIAEVRVCDKVAFTFGDQNSIFQIENSSTTTANQGQQMLNQSQGLNSQKQAPAILTLEFEIPRQAIISNMVFASQQPAFSRSNFKCLNIETFVQETKSTQRMLQISENESDEDKHLKIDAIGLSKKFRVQFLCMSYSILDVAIKFEKNESLDFSEEACNFLKVLFGEQDHSNTSRLLEKDDMINLFKICFDTIKIYGYQLNVSPLASQCLSLLNISHILRKSGRVDDAIECEILLGLSMLSSRKYIQASEILKKCSQHFIQKYKQTNQSEFNLLFFQGKQHFLDNTPKMRKTNKEQTQRQKNEETAINSGNNTSVQGSKRGIIGSSGNSYHSYSEQQCIGTNNKYLLRAAKMELLVADSINHPSMIIEKLQAYQRATEYFTNQQYKEIDFQGSYDVYSGLLQLCPFLCKFLVKTLSDTFEPIKLAGIRGLEFLIEYLGCTLGNYLPQILSEIFKTYPSMNDLSVEQTQNQSFSESQSGSENITTISGSNSQKLSKSSQDSNRNRSHAFIEGIGQSQSQQDQKNYPQNNDQQNTFLKSQNLINFKIIIDMYHHLLESFLNVLASASSQILRVIFSDVIINNLFKQEVNPELKIYCIRVTEKILAICQGDIEVSPQIINEVINLQEEMNTRPNMNVNLKFHVNKLWESIKLKYIYNMGSQQMNKLIEWIASNLIQLSENENFQNFSFLYHLLDITSVICYKQNGPSMQKKNNLINTSRSQKEIAFNSHFQEKSNPITPTSLQNGVGLQNANQKTNSSQILTTQNYNQSQDYESHNVIMKFYFKLKSQKAALIVNQNELINIEYLLKPLIIWVENSLQYQTKLELFRSIWHVLIEVLIALSNSSSSQKQLSLSYEQTQSQQIQFLQDASLNKNLDQASIFFKNNNSKQLSHLTIADIALPLLQKINQHIQNQQPNEKMLQFLVIITNSLLQFPQESQTILFFFLKFFDSYVQCIPHSIYDETFIIFDNLCDIIAPKNFTPRLIEQCINMLLDQYTVKGKAHRKSKDKFIQVILQTRQNLYEALQKLLFENQELLIITKKKNDTKLCSQMQELFSEKLSLVSEIFSQLNKENFFVIEELIQSNKLQKLILDLINSRNSKSRLKGLNILKVLFEQYLEIYSYTIKPIVRLNRQDAYFIKLMLICLKRGLENERDSKLQFNALLILDQFFQHLFKGPNLSQEIKLSSSQKNKQIHNSQSSNSTNIDQIENLISQINEQIEFDSMEYLQFRQKEILKLWPIISMLIDSPWSNIRSIAYGIICYWVKDSSGLSEKKFLSYLINTLQSLLTSKESECRTGGLNILGSMCGLGFNFDQLQNDFKDNKSFVEFFRRNSDLIPYSLWETVYDMQFDWDQTNQAASIILVQLCAPKDLVKNIVKNRQSGLTFKITQRASQQLQVQSNEQKAIEENLISMAEQWNQIKSHKKQSDQWQLNKKEYQIDDYIEDQYVFWIPQLEKEDIMELISMFKNEFKPPQTLWIERVNYNMEESKQEEIEQNYSWIDEKQTYDGFKQFGLDKEEEILDLDDLGIIEVDDEEWNEYDVVDSDNTRRKIPNLKQKINNISPQLQIRDKSPSMRVVRKSKLQQQQQNLINDSGSDSFSSRVTQSNEKDMKQPTKSPEKANNQIQKSSIIEEESGEDISSQEELHNQANDPYSVVEQYLQIDDGENVRIIDELELMQFLKQNNLALQKNNSNNTNSSSEDRSKKKQNTLQQSSAKSQKMSNYKNQQSSSQNSSGGQQQNNNDKYDKLRPNTPPILIEELPQTFQETNEEEFNSQKYQFNKLNSNQLQQLNNNQINNNRAFDHSSDQKSSFISFSKNSFLPQQKSEEYIYSDSAESDDYQDMFIKQQEFLFRQQKQQKSQLKNNRDIPNRPLSAKLKKEEASMNNNPPGSVQGLGGSNFYHNFEMLPQQSSSLPSIAQVAAGNNNQLINSQNQQINKNQSVKAALPQQVTTKSIKQSIQNLKNNQVQDESSEDEHLNILKSRYSSSKQAITNNSDAVIQNDSKYLQQANAQEKNKSNKQEINYLTNSKNYQQMRYFSPPRPQSGFLKKSDLKYINEQNYEQNQNGVLENELLSSPFDQNTDIVNLDSPSPPYKSQISSQSQQIQQNQSNKYQQQQQIESFKQNNNNNKSSSGNKNKSKESSNSLMGSIGYYSNDSSELKNNNSSSNNINNNSSTKQQQILQNNYIVNQEESDKSQKQSNGFYQDIEKISNSIANSQNNNIQNQSNNNSNSKNLNTIQQLDGILTNQQLTDQQKNNQIQNNLSNSQKGNYLNGIIQNFGIPGANSFEEQYQEKVQNIENRNNLQNQIQNSEQLLQVPQSGQISERALLQEQTNNSISAAQGSFSYLNISQFQAYQNPLTSVSQTQAIQQIANSTNPTNKFISEKININRLVSVPSNYKAHFGTNSSLSGIYPNNNTFNVNYNQNSSNSNQLFNTTLNATLNQNQSVQHHNNTLASHNSTSNLFKNVALNSSNQQQNTHTLPSKSTGQTQSSRSKDRLLKKLMEKNIDFNDLKSVWKMSSEIKNISQHHNHSHSSNQNHLISQNNQNINFSSTQQQHYNHQQNSSATKQFAIHYNPHQNQDIQFSNKDLRAYESIQNFLNEQNYNQQNTISKFQRSNSLGRNQMKASTSASNLLTPLQLPIQSNSKTKKDSKKKKIKKKIEKLTQNSSYKNNFQGNNHLFVATSQSQQNTARNHHQVQQYEKKIASNGVNSERNMINQENQVAFKKSQHPQGVQNNVSINSPQRKSLQSSPSQEVGNFSLEKKSKRNSKTKIQEKTLNGFQGSQKEQLPTQKQGNISNQQMESIDEQ